MTEKEIFVENLFCASGASGMKKQSLYRNFSSVEDIRTIIYMIQKAVDNHNKDWINCDSLFLDAEEDKSWTEWHHVEEAHSDSWGFTKRQTGCYIYGLFKQQPKGIADFLDENVFYIGESRSITRCAMIGRKYDFKSSVKNNPLAPYGIGIMFKEKFGKENFQYVYQAYYPLPAHKCKEQETQFLVDYFRKYEHIPVCNHESDHKRIKELATNLDIFYD